jgi:hypothetical protein
MSDAADYPRMAAQCIEAAERMSLRADRARLLEMAQRWLRLAEGTEARAPETVGQPGTPADFRARR